MDSQVESQKRSRKTFADNNLAITWRLSHTCLIANYSAHETFVKWLYLKAALAQQKCATTLQLACYTWLCI